MRRSDALWLLAVMLVAVGAYVGGSCRNSPDDSSGTMALPDATAAIRKEPIRSSTSEPESREELPPIDEPEEQAEPGDSSATRTDEADPEVVPSMTEISKDEILRWLRTILEREPDESTVTRALEYATRLHLDLLEQIAQVERIAAHAVAREVTHERALLEDSLRGGFGEFLKALGDEPAHPFELLAEDEEFSRAFERQTSGPVLAGPGWNRKDDLPDGTTLSYPPGVHEMDIGSLRREFPRDLTVEGAGMDATLLRLNELSTRASVHSLTFRDLTIDCDNDYLTDIRGNDQVVTLRLVRCRVVRFDMGAGASVMISAKLAAFYATDCRIEAGFGRSPGSGNLFQAGRSFLVRMDRCVIRGPLRSVYDSHPSATYLYRECSFEDMEERRRRHLESPAYGVRFEDCGFSYLPANVAAPSTPRPLSELNPDWR